MRLVIAADGSGASRRAVSFVVRNRAMLGARPEVSLVFVDMPVSPAVTRRLGAGRVAAWRARNRAEALAAARAALRRAGVPFREVGLVGNAGESIAALARKARADLIVMGSHGRGALRNLILGSVATKVLATCRVPVLIVR
jgi:nucleotide-binding universal stress UspA family protein